MEKIKFIYIENDRSPKGEFNALKLSKKDKMTLHPSWNEEQIKNIIVLYPIEDNDHEVFIYGLGRKKVGKTNKVTVPVFSGNIEDWDDYINAYGQDCLFYSLTGYTLDDSDCCHYLMRSEFRSIMLCKGGIIRYQEYVEKLKEIQNIQKKVFSEKLSFFSNWELKCFIEKNLIYPSFRILYIPISPYVDTVTDDAMLERFYRTYRNNELKTSHPEYKRMVELDELMATERNKEIYNQVKISQYLSERKEISSRITEHIVKVLNKEIGEGICFHISMKERMQMLFGKRCGELYEEILTDFM